MSDLELRTKQLQQIPVFALRKAVEDLLQKPEMEQRLHPKVQTAAGKRVRNVQGTIRRLTREQLTRLINDLTDEIPDAAVQELFEDYRYGVSPSFTIYLFNSSRTHGTAWEGFRPRFEEELAKFKTPVMPEATGDAAASVDETEPGVATAESAREHELPRIRAVYLNDLSTLPDRPDIIEGNYRFLARLDYVDAHENVVSVYQTLYGFFWVNTAEGYAIIQARAPEVLDALRGAIEKGAGIRLEPLVITKHLKKALTFLSGEALRSSRLHDPDPDSERFRWLTIQDDKAWVKGYRDWENQYPEVRTLRYRESVGVNDRQTTLTVRCDIAVFGLAGRIPASEFRAWCLSRLEQLVRTLNKLRSNLPAYFDSQELRKAPELTPYEKPQQDAILTIVSALLNAKQNAVDLLPTGSSGLELAATLGRLAGVEIYFSKPTSECPDEGRIACPNCQSTFFTVTRSENGQLGLACQAGKKPDWQAPLPVGAVCELGHRFTLNQEQFEVGLSLAPSVKLTRTIRDLINFRLPGYRFEPEQEGFRVRSGNLEYYANRRQVTTTVTVIEKTEIHKTEITVQQSAGTQTGGSMTAVAINSLKGDVTLVNRVGVNSSENQPAPQGDAGAAG